MMNQILKTRFITRYVSIDNQQFHTSIRLLNVNDSSSSSDSSSSDTEKLPNTKARVNKVPAERDDEAKKNTLDLLNNLLEKMTKESSSKKTMDRAIPERTPLPKPVPPPTLEEKLVDAAKNVATSLGGDVKQIEEDLLNKVFSAGAPDSTDTKSESSTPSKLSLSDLLKGMKIEKRPEQVTTDFSPSRRAQVQELARKFRNVVLNTNQSMPTRRRTMSIRMPGNLYGGTRLNIFEPITDSTSNDYPNLKTWQMLEKNELKLMLTNPPENIFEEMIQWTERGILWKFPIDNEIGMEEEQNIHFSEHVFMERHLRDWCPKKGPIPHFMELVCVGLSKNPYMTAQEKKDHIMWYRDFFGSKQELLKEIGAIDKNIIESNATKQIQA